MSPASAAMKAGTSEPGVVETTRSRYGIDKLTDDNYYSWAWNCRLLLEENDVWDLVEGSEPRPAGSSSGTSASASKAETEWEKKNRLALRIISFTIIERLQAPIRVKDVTAKMAWDTLEHIHAPKNTQRRLHLLRNLHRITMASGSSLADHERQFNSIVEGLAVMGRIMETEDLVAIYANSLPKEYSAWLQGQMAVLENVELAIFMGMVREETQRMVDYTSVGGGNEAAIQSSASFARKKNAKDPGKIKCHRCGKLGHIARKCKGKLVEQNNDDDEKAGPSNSKGEKAKGFGGLAYSYQAAANPNVSPYFDMWVLDSGATDFMHPDRERFVEYRALKTQRHIYGIGESSIVAVGIGSMIFTSDDGKCSRRIRDILHVPKLKNGLFSLTRATLMGWTATFQNNGCTVTDGKFKIYAPITDNLCWWKSKTQQISAYSAVSTMLDDWHERLGHVSRNAILDCAKKDIVEGLVVMEGGHLGEECEACAIGKHHRRPFAEVDKRCKDPLGLVHSDLCGKFPVEGLGGGQYFVTFTDDCTRFCKVYILPNKSSATLTSVFQEYQAWAERQTGFKLKAIRTDGGGEYEKWMNAHLKGSGIEHQPTASHTPQSNGVSERMNRTLMDMVDPMMARAKVPKKLWTEAVMTACYIRNRLPTTSLHGKTPYEAWSGNVPSVSHIRKFGCLVYRHIPKKTRRKLDNKAMKGILVGYVSESGMYRVYHPQKDSIAVSRDLLIFEDKIDAMANHPAPDFAGIFDDVEQEVSVPDARPIYDEVMVLIPPRKPATQAPATPQASPEPEVEATSPSIDPEPEEEPTAPTRTPFTRNEEYLLCARKPISYKVNVARAFSAIVEPHSYDEAMNGENSKQWESAMEAEFASIVKNECWELVPSPTKGRVVGSRWVYRVKDGGLLKARFCAKGFTQRWGEDYDETYAPVAKYTSIRTLIALTAGKKFHGKRIHQMDVKTAFLCSKLLETVYIHQPKGFEVAGKEDWVYRLKKSLYGLKQSPRAWYQTIAPVFEQLGFAKCGSDHSIFVSTKAGITTYIALYVDDLLIISEDDDHLAEVKGLLAEKFEMKDLGVARKFLGMEIEYDKDGSIKIHQEQYIQSLLSKHGMRDCNSVTTPLDTSIKLVRTTDAEATADPKEYQSIIGGLMFAAIVTRPDIMCAVRQLSQFNSNPSTKHLAAVKRVLRYLRGTA